MNSKKSWFRCEVFHDGEMARILRLLKARAASIVPEGREVALIIVQDRASGECWAYMDHEATALAVGAVDSDAPHDSARYLLLSEEKLQGGYPQPQFP